LPLACRFWILHRQRVVLLKVGESQVDLARRRGNPAGPSFLGGNAQVVH
jgi:hypothetical protein